MENSKKLTPEEMDALTFIENEHFDGDDVPENEMWSTDHVVNLMSNFAHKSHNAIILLQGVAEKDALLKEANDIITAVYDNLCNHGMKGIVSRKNTLLLFNYINKTTGNEAGKDVR